MSKNDNNYMEIQTDDMLKRQLQDAADQRGLTLERFINKILAEKIDQLAQEATETPLHLKRYN